MHTALGHTAIGRLRTAVSGVSVSAAAGAALLSGWAVARVSLQGGGIGACVAVLAMVTPVAFARRAPVAVAGIVAVGTLVNELWFGHLVRCGPGLPAAFYVAYVVAVGTVGLARWCGLGLVLVGVAAQCVWDPRLGPSQIGLMGCATLLFFGAGAVVRERSGLAAQLRERNSQLREQRELTAQMAVTADQTRIGDELIRGLKGQIQHIAQVAAAARTGAMPTGAGLAVIERTGRATLDRMREVVGTIQSAPTDPEPDLRALAQMLRTATACDVQLSVEGEERALPTSIELSSYRIVERLVSALTADPAARAQVRVRFEPESLHLSVTGPLAPDSDATTSFEGVLDRAALHGGTVSLTQPVGRLDAWVRLPLVTSGA